MNIRNRIKVINQNIYLKPPTLFSSKSEKLEGVMLLDSPKPVISVFEDKNLVRVFRVEPVSENPDLTGQFLHYSISIQDNDAVMIDGIISKQKDHYSNWELEGYEAIRLQPFFLEPSQLKNASLMGKGLFERGLHYSGIITPTNVRNICICDYCRESFTIQHIHAGFSEVQYFYSSENNQTLLVRYGEIENLPCQLESIVRKESLIEVEKKLPGEFKYYNALPCSHCKKPFIDFENNKGIRAMEYYANKLINTDFVYLV